MFNFTHSPGGQKFGNIWISGGVITPPVPPVPPVSDYYDFYGPIVDMNLFRNDTLETSDVSKFIKTYPHATLIEQGTNYKLYDIDEYLIWDSLYNSVADVQRSSERTQFNNKYGYGAIYPDGATKCFGDGEKIGMLNEIDPSYQYVYYGNLRRPFAYRLLGKYIRWAEDTPSGTPTVVDIQSRIGTVISILGSYSDSGKIYAGCTEAVTQPTGTVYTAPNVPTQYTQSAIEEVANIGGSIQYWYEKGVVMWSSDGKLGFQVVPSYDIGEHTSNTAAIEEYKKPHMMNIYPLVPFITFEQNAGQFIYQKAQKPKYYPPQVYSGNNIYESCVYGGPETYTDTSGRNYDADSFNANLIGYNTAFHFQNAMIGNNYKKMSIKYNVEERLYKIPINVVMYKYGHPLRLMVRRPIEAVGFVGYMSLFEVDPALLTP